MQLPEPAPPPLAPLWDRVLRARALPPDLDVELLYVAIRDRLIHPEWEVRLHALRVLADLLPLSRNALSFPFDQVVDNLGHNSPNVRKAALDALKAFSSHCEDPECAARAILDKCSYNNIRPHSADIDVKVNVVTGLILSIPSVMAILKRRHPHLDTFPIFQVLGEKLFDHVHRDAALRSLVKLRRVCGPRDYMTSISRLDFNVQDKFRFLCEKYDEDSLDVHFPMRKTHYQHSNNELGQMNQDFTSRITTPLRMSTDSSSEDSFGRVSHYNNNFGKVIIETEIKFDSDTAITMTVLEENDTESERNTYSDCDSSDRNMLKYSDEESEDPDVVVKRVRFGGESVKIRTPDSDNLLTSEEERRQNKPAQDNLEQASRPVTPVILNKVNEIKWEAQERENLSKTVKKSGIPLPVLAKPVANGNAAKEELQKKKVKIKSKSLSELYDYFRSKNDGENGGKESLQLALGLEGSGGGVKLPSPVEGHREVEVLHNLQRSPSVSPRRRHSRVEIDEDGFVQNILASSPQPMLDLLSARRSPMRRRYSWEELAIVPDHVADQLHCTENWIATVRAADQLHSALLQASVVRSVEPAASSLVQHMWALSDAVPAAHAPAEGAVCALFRGARDACARSLLPALVARLAHEPPPAALPHALLQRLALHNLVDLIFDPDMIGGSGDRERVVSQQLSAALCVSRAAGPAAVLAAVRRRLARAGDTRADAFCRQLRERLNRPMNNGRATHMSRSSQLPLPLRRRARSTPPPAGPPPPRRLRPLPDSAPLMGVSQVGKATLFNPLPLTPYNDRDSSAVTTDSDKTIEKPIQDEKSSVDGVVANINETDIPAEDDTARPSPSPPPRSHSPSIQVEDFSEKSNPSLQRIASQNSRASESNAADDGLGSQQSLNVEWESPEKHSSGRQSSQSKKSTPVKQSQSGSSTPNKSGKISPDSRSAAYDRPTVCERDVRIALAECIVPARHEDWEVIVNALVEMERLASDAAARAPAASWRGAARSAAAHVRSLRSRVARAACSALGALYEHRGRALDPEIEECVTALLDRCADVNRFLRADASTALARTACGAPCSRAAAALCRRGATHRAGPVRAAAAQALTKLVQNNSSSKILELPVEPRAVLLRAAGELLGDAHAETRLQARHLCYALAQDARFRPMLKESMQLTRYKAIEKYLDKL